nr:MAG TPA: hypothetical protein [Caudoviricetes sp.]
MFIEQSSFYVDQHKRGDDYESKKPMLKHPFDGCFFHE